eukprot:TRINITY_DN24992_c0_g1_i1.p2 TRINITY_DN24992_c0_g1~~TRINITY_DN24992_c0_g1_i1.p2  ORF type:complete len:113 (+),score=22.19 TRINITY_DN24992_c0_g1_i1:103-441(+)
MPIMFKKVFRTHPIVILNVVQMRERPPSIVAPSVAEHAGVPTTKTKICAPQPPPRHVPMPWYSAGGFVRTFRLIFVSLCSLAAAALAVALVRARRRGERVEFYGGAAHRRFL